jgi:hypothetical protein
MRLVALAALVGLCGCHRAAVHCAPGTRSTVEVRNGSGALELALKGKELCDGQLRPVGALEVKKGVVTLTGPDGNVALTLTRESPTTAAGRDRQGPKLRLYRDARELRVLRGDGVPLGSIVEHANGSTLYNPASSPIGKVERRDRDAVVTDMGGTAETYIVPARDAAAAGVFGVPKLERPEQLAIYLFWAH